MIDVPLPGSVERRAERRANRLIPAQKETLRSSREYSTVRCRIELFMLIDGIPQWNDHPPRDTVILVFSGIGVRITVAAVR